jgi:hypothetical protein
LILEGGTRGKDSKLLQIEARRAVHRFLVNCGYRGRLPAVDLMGSRGAAYETFVVRLAHAPKGSYVALWVDSEDPVADIEKPWAHLKTRDGWDQPEGATDDHALLMVTSMETWIASDRPTLQAHYGSRLRDNKLPPLVEIENRSRKDVFQALCDATHNCSNAYAKGVSSFVVFAKLSPAELQKHLPSFKRFQRILDARL